MVQNVKVETVKQTVDRLGRSQSVVLVRNLGLTVAQISELRGKLREADSELKVVKNRLAKRALAEAKCEAMDDLLTGPTAMAFGYGDPTGPPKICTKFADDNDRLEVLGGLLEGARIDLAKVKALAKLPSREELLSQMASTMKAPMRQMAVAMNQAVAKLAYAMKNRAEQLEGQEA